MIYATPEATPKDYIKEVYKNMSIPKRHKISLQRDVVFHSQMILKIIREGLEDYEGGVMIDGLGYFNVWLSPKPMLGREDKYWKTLILNNHVDGKTFCVNFSSECTKNSVLKGWSCDYFLHKNIFKNIKKRLMQGNVYLNFFNYFRGK